MVYMGEFANRPMQGGCLSLQHYSRNVEGRQKMMRQYWREPITMITSDAAEYDQTQIGGQTEIRNQSKKEDSCPADIDSIPEDDNQHNPIMPVRKS